MDILDMLNAEPPTPPPPPPPPPAPLTPEEEAALRRAARAVVTTKKTPNPTDREADVAFEVYMMCGESVRRLAIEMNTAPEEGNDAP